MPVRLACSRSGRDHVAPVSGHGDAHDQHDSENIQQELEQQVEATAEKLPVEQQVREILIDRGQRRADEQDTACPRRSPGA